MALLYLNLGDKYTLIDSIAGIMYPLNLGEIVVFASKYDIELQKDNLGQKLYAVVVKPRRIAYYKNILETSIAELAAMPTSDIDISSMDTNRVFASM